MNNTISTSPEADEAPEMGADSFVVVKKIAGEYHVSGLGVEVWFDSVESANTGEQSQLRIYSGQTYIGSIFVDSETKARLLAECGRGDV